MWDVEILDSAMEVATDIFFCIVIEIWVKDLKKQNKALCSSPQMLNGFRGVHVALKNPHITKEKLFYQKIQLKNVR